MTALKLNERQKKFAEYYAQCGNTVQSAIKAGYSEKYANANACKLLENVRVAEHIKNLTEKLQEARIMTARERQITLSDMAKNAENAPTDRIKAIDVLNKMTGEYLIKVEADVDTSINICDALSYELYRLGIYKNSPKLFGFGEFLNYGIISKL